MSLGLFSVRVFRVYRVSIILPLLHIHIRLISVIRSIAGEAWEPQKNAVYLSDIWELGTGRYFQIFGFGLQ